MPVQMDEYDEEIDLTPGTTKSTIVCFLYENRGLGYRPVEIQEALDLPRGTTATTLTRLVDDGYVGKTSDSIYYALDERDDLARYAATREQTTRMFEHHEREPDESPSTPTEIDTDAIEAEVAELDEAVESEFDL
jgi:hypothetical protein